MVRAVLEDEDKAEPLPFVGSHRLGDGKAVILGSLRALIGVILSTYRAQPDPSAAFALLHSRVEASGFFVTLKGDLGNYVTAIETTVFRGFSIADKVAPFVVINDQDARSSWSFTLLHETTHLLLGQTGVSGEYSEKRKQNGSAMTSPGTSCSLQMRWIGLILMTPANSRTFWSESAHLLTSPT